MLLACNYFHTMLSIIDSSQPTYYISSTLQGHRLAVTGIIPGKDFPYSDHEGVEATFLLEERDVPTEVPQRIYDGEMILHVIN